MVVKYGCLTLLRRQPAAYATRYTCLLQLEGNRRYKSFHESSTEKKKTGLTKVENFCKQHSVRISSHLSTRVVHIVLVRRGPNIPTPRPPPRGVRVAQRGSKPL